MLGGLVTGVTLVLLAFGTPAAANHNNFREAAPCNGTASNMPAQRRSLARAYSYVAAMEGYQWGGGCWDRNNRKFGEPPFDPDEVWYPAEGPDCTGLVYKSWFLRAASNDPGFRYHSTFEGNNLPPRWPEFAGHGPFITSHFKGLEGRYPHFFGIGRSIATRMDAWVAHVDQGTQHMGLIWKPRTRRGRDRIMEAKCETCGVGTWVRTYRRQSIYSAVRRSGWVGG